MNRSKTEISMDILRHLSGKSMSVADVYKKDAGNYTVAKELLLRMKVAGYISELSTGRKPKYILADKGRQFLKLIAAYQELKKSLETA